MNLTLLHGSMEPLIYGGVIFLGLASMLWKWKSRRYLAFALEVGVFALVFELHGGTMTGGFAATVASLMAGLFLPLMLKGTSR